MMASTTLKRVALSLLVRCLEILLIRLSRLLHHSFTEVKWSRKDRCLSTVIPSTLKHFFVGMVWPLILIGCLGGAWFDLQM